MKHATLSCPSCGTAIDLKVVFNPSGSFGATSAAPKGSARCDRRLTASCSATRRSW